MDETERSDTLEWLLRERGNMAYAGEHAGLTLTPDSCRELASWLDKARLLAVAGAEAVEAMQKSPAPELDSVGWSDQKVLLTVPLIRHPDLSARLLIRELGEYLVRNGFGTQHQVAQLMEDEQRDLRRGGIGGPNRAEPGKELF